MADNNSERPPKRLKIFGKLIDEPIDLEADPKTIKLFGKFVTLPSTEPTKTPIVKLESASSVKTEVDEIDHREQAEEQQVSSDEEDHEQTDEEIENDDSDDVQEVEEEENLLQVNRRWEVKYQMVSEFVDEFQRLPTEHDNPYLFKWVNKQIYMREKLSKDKIDRLDQLEILWISKKKAEWQRNYHALRKYQRDAGHTYPQPGTPLEEWATNQRILYSKGKLSENKIHMLNAIEFDWEISAEKFKLPRRSKGQLRGAAKRKKMYKELKHFQQEYNHFRFPSDSHLYAWVKKQRKLHKSKKLPADQVEKLTSIGFKWEEDPTEKRKPSDEYDILINDLKAFKAKHGHVNVPKGSLLSVWLAQMKTRSKKNAIMKLWKDELEGLGVTL